MSSASSIAASARNSPFAIFRNRSFTLLWIGQLISTMGSALTSLAASILVYRQTGSALSVGLMLMATAAPSLLVGLFAGVLVDRVDRKRIMIFADLLRAFLVLLIPFLVPMNIAWLYILMMLISSIGQFFDPAHESILPEIASEQELAAANSMMAISSFGSTAIGFAASGLIAARADIRWVFYIDAISFCLSAFFIFLVKIQPLEVSDRANISLVFRNLKSGLRFMLDTPALKSLFQVLMPVLIGFGLSNALLLPFAERALGATEFEYGIQEGMTSLGFVVGSLLLAGLFDRMREGVWITVSLWGMALAGIIYSFTSSVPIAIIVLTFSGLMNAPSSIARRVVIQRNTPREMRGRVNSTFFVSRDVLYLVGMGAAGLADLLDIRLMYLFSALFVLVSAIWVFYLPGLRQEAAEWKRAVKLLYAASKTPALEAGRNISPSDLDALIGLIPPLASLDRIDREALLETGEIVSVTEGSTIITHGESGDDVFFILSGRAIAGAATPDGGYRSLSSITVGDFFGEIAAITGKARTADVVAEQPTSLLKISSSMLRAWMQNPTVNEIFLSKMSERLNLTSIKELPRFAGVDQNALKALRTAEVLEQP